MRIKLSLLVVTVALAVPALSEACAINCTYTGQNGGTVIWIGLTHERLSAFDPALRVLPTPTAGIPEQSRAPCHACTSRWRTSGATPIALQIRPSSSGLGRRQPFSMSDRTLGDS